MPLPSPRFPLPQPGGKQGPLRVHRDRPGAAAQHEIQIMTLTGAVVREIFMPELGPLHIGNNLTDYAWDGTDQYGDRLANGTYLYRVALDDPNGQFSQTQNRWRPSLQKRLGQTGADALIIGYPKLCFGSNQTP